MNQPFTDADVELVAETIAADLGLEAWRLVGHIDRCPVHAGRPDTEEDTDGR